MLKEEPFLLTIRISLVGLVCIYLMLEVSCLMPYIIQKLTCPVVF